MSFLFSPNRTAMALAASVLYLTAWSDVASGAPWRDLLDDQQAARVDRAVAKGVAVLSREVPGWPVENGCYSCHNQGDGARALLAAELRGLTPENPSENPSGKPTGKFALEGTLQWLLQASDWNEAEAEDEFHDEQLSALQFGYALTVARQGRLAEHPGVPDSLRTAARRLIEHQRDDGSWQVGAAGSLGSPVTYGAQLGTVVALQILRAAQREMPNGETQNGGAGEAIRRGEQWLLSQKPRNVMAAAALLLGSSHMRQAGRTSERMDRLAGDCLELLEQSQFRGGWGPYRTSRLEAFDTALALAALVAWNGGKGDQAMPLPERSRKMIRGGIRHLLETQLDDGTWPETTRPAGAASYAHQISTTSWALEALLPFAE